jgi:hypothetical protein
MEALKRKVSFRDPQFSFSSSNDAEISFFMELKKAGLSGEMASELVETEVLTFNHLSTIDTQIWRGWLECFERKQTSILTRSIEVWNKKQKDESDLINPPGRKSFLSKENMSKLKTEAVKRAWKLMIRMSDSSGIFIRHREESLDTKTVENLIGGTLVGGTINGHLGRIEAFERRCRVYGFQPWQSDNRGPVNEAMLLRYCTDIANEVKAENLDKDWKDYRNGCSLTRLHTAFKWAVRYLDFDISSSKLNLLRRLAEQLKDECPDPKDKGATIPIRALCVMEDIICGKIQGFSEAVRFTVGFFMVKNSTVKQQKSKMQINFFRLSKVLLYCSRRFSDLQRCCSSNIASLAKGNTVFCWRTKNRKQSEDGFSLGGEGFLKRPWMRDFAALNPCSLRDYWLPQVSCTRSYFKPTEEPADWDHLRTLMFEVFKTKPFQGMKWSLEEKEAASKPGLARRFMAELLLAAGEDLEQVKTFMGHTAVTSTLKYAQKEMGSFQNAKRGSAFKRIKTDSLNLEGAKAEKWRMYLF